MKQLLLMMMLTVATLSANGQDVYNQIDEEGNVTRRTSNTNFNPYKNDSTQKKVVPKGLYVWTVSRLGDIRKAEIDTVPHLFPNTLYNHGTYGEYNTIGSNYTARESRIFIDRQPASDFLFIDPYSYVLRSPETWHFTNTLSPITNIIYDNCGSKQDGEDHIDARFAVNAGKRIGAGFDLNYAYARGYFQNQNVSHFGATFYGSYLGDQYQMHTMLVSQEHKTSENGGIEKDDYITHPEHFDDSYSENEIPTSLERNWNRNMHLNLFLTHRYSLGFYRKEKMSDEEIKARQFAQASKREKELKAKEKEKNNGKGSAPKGRPEGSRPMGRPEGAKIAGKEPGREPAQQTDSTRIQVETDAVSDSLLAEQARQDSIEATMKKVFVPVTSIIHTLDLGNYSRRHIAYATPDDYYANTYYNRGERYGNDSIFDQTKSFQISNTLAIALMEGFNKYMKAGVKVFATHEFRNFQLPDTLATGRYYTSKWREQNLIIGGEITKTQGKTLHYVLGVEAWVLGDDFGQLKADFSTDLNFPLFGDTVQLAANAYFHRLYPTFYQSRYHSKHFWWDCSDLSSITRTRVEGLFSYTKTDTRLRVAVEEMQNYTYTGLYYDNTDSGRKNLSATIMQEKGNINVFTAQLMQNFKLGILHWDNIITYQNSSNTNVLPLPALNIFSNLYLKFRIAKVLTVELGGDAFFFTKYNAPDFCSQLNQFAIQQNKESRKELGNFPFVDVYANLHLKHTRFFVIMGNMLSGSGNRMTFLTPHYPTNSTVMRMGLSWNFFN